MTNIFDLNTQVQKKKKQSEDFKVPEEYLRILNGIDEIKKTEGYKVIKKFWENKFQEALEGINNTDASEIGKIAKLQGKLDLSGEFLYYISTYEK